MTLPEEEEIKTYSLLVDKLRTKLKDYMRGVTEDFKGSLRSLKLPQSKNINPSDETEYPIISVDGGSGFIPLADKLVAFIAAIAIIDNGKAYERIIADPEVIIQPEKMLDGEFMDSVDTEREALLLKHAREVIEKRQPRLLLIDGPLIPRPEYAGEYLYQLKAFLEIAEKLKTNVVGFVKRPQSKYIEEFEESRFQDRPILSAFLDVNQACPWPPRLRRSERIGRNIKYTYIRLLEPPSSGVFRCDFPDYMSDEEILETLKYLVVTSDPRKGIPAMIAKADEEVRISKKLIVDLFKECFETIITEIDPKLWGPLAPRWGEIIW